MSNMQADPGVPLRALEIDDLYTMLQLVLDKMEVGYSVTLTFAALYCIVMLILLRELGLFSLSQCTLSRSFCIVIGL